MMILDHATEFSLGFAGVLSARPAGWPAWQTAVELCIRALAPQCITAFFFASGFFMYRFSRTWQGAWSAAKSIAVRYALWAIPGYLAIAIYRRSFDPLAFLLSFLQDGPYYGTYWFLTVLFQFSLLTPLLVKWVDRSLRTAIFACVALQLLATGYYYWQVAHGDAAWLRLAPWRLPFFLAGMLVSAHADRVLRYLLARRRLIGAAAAVLQLVLVGECVLWGAIRGDGSPSSWLYGLDKLSLVASSTALVAWALTTPSRNTRTRTWLTTLGMNSLAVLLMSDLCFMLIAKVLWHAGEVVGLPRPAPGVPPEYLKTLWIAVPFFFAGLFGPLQTANVVERLLGKPARRLVFG